MIVVRLNTAYPDTYTFKEGTGFFHSNGFVFVSTGGPDDPKDLAMFPANTVISVEKKPDCCCPK